MGESGEFRTPVFAKGLYVYFPPSMVGLLGVSHVLVVDAEEPARNRKPGIDMSGGWGRY